MKTKLMLAALLAAASIAQAGPPMTPAKVKNQPLHISQIKGIFSRSQSSAPVPQQGATTAAAATSNAKTAATSNAKAAASAASAAVPSAPAPIVTKPAVKKVHVTTFLNHPVTAPGPH